MNTPTTTAKPSAQTPAEEARAATELYLQSMISIAKDELKPEFQKLLTKLSQ